VRDGDAAATRDRAAAPRRVPCGRTRRGAYRGRRL